MRWFAEAAWYPTALLPSQGVQWEAVDDHSAYATIVDGPITLRLLFEFDAAVGAVGLNGWWHAPLACGPS